MTGEVLFTADPHLGHTLVSGLRGFSTVEEHDSWIAQRWIERVKSDDQIWVLGDLTLGNLTNAFSLLSSLPGKKHIVFGNHDVGHPMHRNSNRKQRAYLEVFESVQPFARRKMNGRDVLLSHFPYSGDSKETDRHTQWRLPNQGAWLLHGHTHQSKPMTEAEFVRIGGEANRLPTTAQR